jgi:23S rRNA pseudouridine1911/1915/1917 synthase
MVSMACALFAKTTGVYPRAQKSVGSYTVVLSCYNPRVPSDQIELLASPADSGTRLDRFVAANCPDLSRSRVQELIDSGLVQVNRQPCKPSQKLKGGERITVRPEPRAPLKAEAESIPLAILYEDDDLIVINKPAGMTVHAGAGNSRGTLVNALLGRGQSLSQGGNALRPGIVHRLDKDTSGAILIAKNDFAHAKLSEAFRTRAIQKTYLALVHGKLNGTKGRIELAISRDPKRRTKMSARPAGKSANARLARTDWTVLQQLGPAAFVEVQLHTGRTHQIRVHFSALKHPVVGDALYGAASQLTVGKIKLPVLGRQFLHAARLSFAHPRTEKEITVTAPLAPELKIYLEKLAAATGASKIDASLAAFL